jgi:hypothetical protein
MTLPTTSAPLSACDGSDDFSIFGMKPFNPVLKFGDPVLLAGCRIFDEALKVPEGQSVGAPSHHRRKHVELQVGQRPP